MVSVEHQNTADHGAIVTPCMVSHERHGALITPKHAI